MKLEIVYLKTSSLKPYNGNARKHEDADIQTIVNSIKRFGFRDPIGIWGKDNLIVEGHGRWIAAQRLGLETVPCIRLDDMTDEERKAYALAHNKTAEMSQWDFELLNMELDDISGIDMTDFGFAVKPDVLDYGDVPTEFQEYDDDMEVKHICPRCGYEWK